MLDATENTEDTLSDLAILMDTEVPAAEEAIHFRSSKRRKVNRVSRPEPDENGDTSGLDTTAVQEHGDTASEVEAIRAPRAKSRKVGIIFSNSGSRNAALEPADLESKPDLHADQMVAITSRFVTHSDQVVDVDKHMCVSPIFR